MLWGLKKETRQSCQLLVDTLFRTKLQLVCHSWWLVALFWKWQRIIDQRVTVLLSDEGFPHYYINPPHCWDSQSYQNDFVKLFITIKCHGHIRGLSLSPPLRLSLSLSPIIFKNINTTASVGSLFSPLPPYGINRQDHYHFLHAGSDILHLVIEICTKQWWCFLSDNWFHSICCSLV